MLLVAPAGQKVHDFMALSPAERTAQCPIASEIAPPNIKMGDSDRDDHHGHAVEGVSHKGEGDAVAFSDAATVRLADAPMTITEAPSNATIARLSLSQMMTP